MDPAFITRDEMLAYVLEKGDFLGDITRSLTVLKTAVKTGLESKGMDKNALHTASLHDIESIIPGQKDSYEHHLQCRLDLIVYFFQNQHPESGHAIDFGLLKRLWNELVVGALHKIERQVFF